MQIITKNNRKYYRFKIGDEFISLTGKGSHNKMLSNNVMVSKEKRDINYNIPIYTRTLKEDHIVGYGNEKSKKYGKYFEKGPYIKYSIEGAQTIISKENGILCTNASILIPKNNINLVNEYVSLYLNKWLPQFEVGTAQKSVTFGKFKEEYIEIPTNHEELAKVIKRILEYKQLSKQLSKQIKDYKLAILQESEKAIKNFKETKQFDKFITFKIGDEFTSISGKGSYNKMKKEGLCSDTYNEEQGFIYPVYSASVQNNHICGYSKKENKYAVYIESPFIKVTTSGEPGLSVYVEEDSFICEKAYAFKGKFLNSYVSLYLSKEIPKYSLGSAQKNAYFGNYKEEYIEIPTNHEELAKKIEQLNNWQIKVDETLKKMEEYIEGVLQQSLK